MPTYKIDFVRTIVSDNTPAPLMSARQAVGYLMKNCYTPDEMWREKVFAVLVDAKNQPVGHVLVSVGGLDSAPIDIRLIARAALNGFARGVILSHNHPTGDPRPSQVDIANTDKLKKALTCLDIQLLDHVVIGDGAFFSFLDEKVAKFKS